MDTPLNPLIIARLRKFWMNYLNNEAQWLIEDLLEELEVWASVLGPGPTNPICDGCQWPLNFSWAICNDCGTSLICDKCYICLSCEIANRSEGCSGCGVSCGAGRCNECR